MPEQTFRSPNFYDREIDKSTPTPQGPVGTPAGLIGTSNRGPAFVPVTVGNFDQYAATFGNLDPKKLAPYAAAAYLANKSSLTFMRVLGAGANSTTTDISNTSTKGTVVNAGFHLDGDLAYQDTRHNHCVQFLVASHTLQPYEAFGQADFTDNPSFAGSTANLVRGMVMMASGSRMIVASADANLYGAVNNSLNNFGSPDASGRFKLIISTSLGNSFYNSDNNPGVKILTASLDPSDTNYFAKVLNTDPDRFYADQHLLYANFAVDAEIASVTGATSTVAMLSGSANTSTTSGDNTLVFRKAFGAFNTRYKTPSTTYFISQPYGTTEYDLFKVEALDDGAYANNLYKISITNLKASLDASKPYGTFTVQIRDWNDTDTNPLVLEQFSNCDLNPESDRYVAKVIGDRKVYFNFDATEDADRRIIAQGRYDNQSAYVRVVMNDAVERGLVPQTALPFGFRGFPVLKTNDTLTDAGVNVGSTVRLGGYLTGSAVALTGSIIPPVPFRTKVTKGQRPTTMTWFGQPGVNELAVPLYYWGAKFERNNSPLDPNIQTTKNDLLGSLTQFMGIEKLDVLVTGSGADTLNANKFTLSKVAFSNASLNDLTASIDTHMREAAYIRDGVVDTTQYTINDGVITNRVTFATLLGKGTASQFNRFSPYLKFTTYMQGGFDGLNILDASSRRMNDKSTSFDAGGAAASGYIPTGMSSNQNGTGQSNSNVSSYVTAINIMTDPMQVKHNLLAIPGIREPFITDYAGAAAKTYGLAYYVMDVPKYDENANRLFDDSTTRPDVDQTMIALDARAIDNDYVGTYFPDVYIDDATNRRRVKVPASVAAYGALSFNDRVSYPWFAPAGFNRASLDFVKNVEIRLTSSDKDRMNDARANPIATYPRQGFVIFGQKTLKIKSSALDRVNVRRLLLEVKRIISDIALKLEFENNTPDVWNKFTSEATLQLGLIKSQSGIETFKVIMNETNNTQVEIDQNKLRGKVIVVPTRVIEFIAIDFVITNSGIQFI